MLFNSKKQKGSTIVEVLVSVIIIGIVSVYGLSFFSSAYKHTQDSKDYNFVLHDLVRKMEMVKAGGYPGEFVVVADENYYPPAGGSSGSINHIKLSDNDQVIYDFKVDKILRKDCKVHYTCSVFVDSRTISGVTEKFDNSTRVVVSGTWPWPESETAYTNMTGKNEIVLVTYMAEIWSL